VVSGLCWAVRDDVSAVSEGVCCDGMLRQRQTGLQRAALSAEMLPSPLVQLALAWLRD